ncbi:heme ABC transporter ATP-binding protein [Dyella sp. GSA-30]|uniref:heme ABC transporter ATP-binding protein n=1 Tax=Dyella sp. GSA-30 TaxID=2994496 RepID=UPI00248F9EFF|nr:heme ABC transporter ATP-binding protein [Dyella sp. GSA-30]BDU21065.1 hemin import ATP-binding protein HmuV [Dyella sp. GSA-30]
MNMPWDWGANEAAEQGSGVIAVRGVHLSIGGRRVLHDVHLKARPGRLLALVGPNGAGKSSLLSVMAGLRRPSLGEVTLDGRSLQAWPAQILARRRAMLSQKVQLGFGFRVDEVVMIGRSPFGEKTGAMDCHLVDAALGAVQASHLRERNYLELSGGEQQRVQLARVLAQVSEPSAAPAWLLLDEPEASLDIAHQHLVLGHARRLAQRGYGVIAVLHDLNLAARYADDVALLAQGQLVRHGKPEDALDSAALSRIYGLPLRRSEVADMHGWLIHPA